MQRSAVLAQALSIVDPHARARALADAIVPEEYQHEVEELVLASEAVHGKYFAWSLIAQAMPHLDETRAALAVELALTTDQPAKVLADVAAYLSPAQLGIALDAAAAADDENLCAATISTLAPHLDQAQVAFALEVVNGLSRPPCRARGLGGLLYRLDPAARDIAAGEVVKTCASHPDAFIAFIGLEEALPQLTVAELRQVVMSAPGNDLFMHAGRIASAGAHLPQPAIAIALDALRAIADPWPRVYGLTELAPHLPAHLRAEVIDEILGTKVPPQVEYLMALAGHMSPGQRERALQIVAATENPLILEIGLKGLAPHLTAAQLKAALAIADLIEDDSARQNMLGVLRAQPSA